jgi:hypothetical protein
LEGSLYRKLPLLALTANAASPPACSAKKARSQLETAESCGGGEGRGEAEVCGGRGVEGAGERFGECGA